MVNQVPQVSDSQDNPSIAGSRRVVLEMTTPNIEKTPRKRKRHRGGNNKPLGENHDALPEPLPLEMTPVVQAIKEYGRRTHALGALQGAHAIRLLLDRVRVIGPDISGDTMMELAREGEKMISDLKSYLHKVYED